MSYDSYGGFGNDLFGPDPLEFADSYGLLHEYQRRAITGKKEDYNYEYDRFPKNFTYSKSFQGAQSNPFASKLDQLHTERFLTNKVRNIEQVYLGSDEYPEEAERFLLPQQASFIGRPCHCALCRQKAMSMNNDTADITKAIEELERKNELLTIVLVFIVIYCFVQLFFSRGHAAYTTSSTIIGQPIMPPVASVPTTQYSAPNQPPAAPIQVPSPSAQSQPVSAPSNTSTPAL